MASLFRRKILANSWVDENTYSLRLPKSHSHRLSRLYKRLLPASVSRRTEVYFACITCSTQSVNGRRFSLSINSSLCLMLEAKVFYGNQLNGKRQGRRGRCFPNLPTTGRAIRLQHHNTHNDPEQAMSPTDFIHSRIFVTLDFSRKRHTLKSVPYPFQRMEGKKIKVANMLPAVLLAILAAHLLLSFLNK